ncbi:MAG: transglycosylase SLT domain-containing protein [Bryobacteraceae bacterium]
MFALLLLAQFSWLGGSDYFKPTSRLSGIGVDREELSSTLIKRRDELMVESQTFSILRDPQALAGAERITRLQKLFQNASQSSGLPASFISAVAFLESWGVANAQSPAGPKGMMQIAQGTARTMGLKLIYATKYNYVTERRLIKGRKGKVTSRTVRRTVPYQVLVRDERLVPERAVPAAANYLAKLEQRYGGRDWAIFAYHCGEGCAAEVRSIVSRSRGLSSESSVAQAFFSANPGHNRELYESLRHHMERDFSPTYFFRISRAEQLLRLYQSDADAYKKLFQEYRNHVNPEQRAPHRLSIWIKPEDLTYKTCEDLKRDQGRNLVQAFDNPKFFGFSP